MQIFNFQCRTYILGIIYISGAINDYFRSSMNIKEKPVEAFIGTPCDNLIGDAYKPKDPKYFECMKKVENLLTIESIKRFTKNYYELGIISHEVKRINALLINEIKTFHYQVVNNKIKMNTKDFIALKPKSSVVLGLTGFYLNNVLFKSNQKSFFEAYSFNLFSKMTDSFNNSLSEHLEKNKPLKNLLILYIPQLKILNILGNTGYKYSFEKNFHFFNECIIRSINITSKLFVNIDNLKKAPKIHYDTMIQTIYNDFVKDMNLLLKNFDDIQKLILN